MAKELPFPESLTSAVLAYAKPEIPRQPMLVLQVDLNEPFGVAVPAKRPFRPVVIVPPNRHPVALSEGCEGTINLAERGFEPLPYECHEGNGAVKYILSAERAVDKAMEEDLKKGIVRARPSVQGRINVPAGEQ